jgi:hypothetical protein
MSKPAKKRLPPRWAEQLRYDMVFAEDAITTKGELPPVFVLHNPDRSVTPFVVPLRDAAHKRRVYQFLALTLLASGAVGFTMMTEAWMRDELAEPGESAEAAMARVERDGPMPSQVSNRKEIVSIVMVYRDDADERQTSGVIGEIVRADDASVAAIKWEVNAETSAAGAMVDIMPVIAPDPRHRAAAARLLIEIGPTIMQVLGIVEVAV